jgi:phospholipase/carboxylesterase
VILRKNRPMSLTTSVIKASGGESPFWMAVLHGLGDSMEGYQWMPEQMRLPWLNYLLINAPDPYFTGFSWFDIEGDRDPGIVRSRGLLFETLDAFCLQHEVSEDHLFVFGFSQGCVMTVETGFRYPHQLAGCIGVSGFIHRPESLIQDQSDFAKRQRFLLTHGTYDPLIPSEPVGQQVEAMKRQGFSMQWQVYPKEHTIYGEVELQCFREFLEEARSEILAS